MTDSPYLGEGTVFALPLAVVNSPPSIPVASTVACGEASVLTDDSTSIGVGPSVDRFRSMVPSANMFVSTGLGFVTGNPRVFLGPPVPVPA